MHPELLPDDHAQSRFKQEAEAASCLTHPNLVAVYGSGMATNKTPYLVMDCLNGKTLAETLKEQGALEGTRAIDILIQCCEALVHMHMKGIVHRDIKPSNIFLTKAENGTDLVKIVDFGIAKIQAYQDSTHLTQTGAVFGSPLYMSPEQCRGEPLDSRSDIYSLGCVAYEMLTGASPFAANNPIKTIVSHVNGVLEPLSKFTTEHPIPKALQSIIMRCLETGPKNRYQTVDELLNLLVTLRDNGKLKTTPCIVSASLYKRFAASVIDGLLLTTLLGIATTLVALGFHMPLNLSIQFCYPTFYSFGFSWIWLDCMILLGPALGTVLIAVLLTISHIRDVPDHFHTLFILLFQFRFIFGLILSWLYFAAFESSRYRATPGKKMFGLAVIGSHGNKLSFLQATGRYLSKILLIPLLIPIINEFTVNIGLRFQNTTSKTAGLRTWRSFRTFLLNPPRLPTDDCSKTYVVNSIALNNPYVPNLNEHLTLQEPMSLNEMSTHLKATLVYRACFVIGICLFLFDVITACLSGRYVSLLVDLYLLWFLGGSLLHFRTLRLRKNKLLATRKTSSRQIPLANPEPRSAS